MRKSKFVALLLAVAITVSVIAPSVSAVTADACPVHTSVTEWIEVAEGTWTGGAIADGHYKLTGNQAITSALTVAGNVCIDLAGYNITAAAAKDNAYRAFEVTGVLTITDTAETDGIISGGRMDVSSSAVPADVKVYGGNILVTGGKLNLYGGEISGGYMKASTYKYHTYGGNIGLVEGAELNIYGGTVKDGKIEMHQQATQYHGGGNIYADASTVNIYGGTVSGGDMIAKYSSGSKDARKAYGVGGNIAVNGGTFYMEGGLIDDGNLEVRCNASGTSAAGSTAHAHGGNVYCIDSTVTIKGGVISNGTLSGEAIIANTEKSPSLEAQGGNLYIKNCTAEIKGNAQILDGEIVNNNTSARGGNLFVAAGTVTMSENAVLSGGTCSTDDARGGNAFVIGTFNINGGTISGGAAGWGSNLMLQSGATINLNDATITGGTGSASVLIQRGTFNMNGGSIENATEKAALSVQGTTDTNGGKAYLNAGVVGDIFTNRISEVHVAAGVTIGKMEKVHASTIELADGVKMQYNPALNEVEGFDAYVMDKSTGTTVYAVYANIADAIAAAKSGNTVSLMRDVTADEVVVPAGVTLNLYGRVLTADAVNATANGAQIKDEKYSENAGGKLVTDSLEVSEENNFAPIKIGGEYHFQKFNVQSQLSGNVFKFYIADAAADVLLDDLWENGSEGTGVKLQVYVTGTQGGQVKSKTFEVGDELIAQYAANWDTKMFTLTFTSDLTGIENLECTVRVVPV